MARLITHEGAKGRWGLDSRLKLGISGRSDLWSTRLTDFTDLRNFYINRVEFDAERNLTVTIECDGVPRGTVTFQSIRNVLFF